MQLVLYVLATVQQTAFDCCVLNLIGQTYFFVK